MHPLLLTTTDDGTGKTAIALALAQLANQRGRRVGYMKPKGTRLQSHLGKTLDRDPLFAAELLGLEDAIEAMEPIVYSPTFIRGVLRGNDDPAALRATVSERAQALAADRDVLIVEGADRIETGSIIGLNDVDLAELLDARVVLTARHRGTGDVDGTLDAAKRFGDRLAGVVFNAIEDGHVDRLEADVAPFLEDRGVPVLGVVPRRRELAGVSAGQLAEELGATVLADAGMDGLIERFLIGAMGREAAAGHLRRTRAAAVITGGDRADIQSVAIEAPGVACLVLTGGHRPAEAVVGRATTAGVPILSVATDTRTTVDRAEAIVSGGRARDPSAIELMRSLLADHADVDRLLGA